MKQMRREPFLVLILIVMFSSKLFANKLIIAKSGGTYTSIQAGINAAVAGDTILVKAGTYNEALTFSKSGSATKGYITLLAETGVILDGTSKGETGILISSQNYIRVIGFEIQKFVGTNTPIGISIEGSSSFLEIKKNVIHNIENQNGNAHGIAFYGNASTPMTDLLIDGNEIKNCKLGQSESMVLNGNVTNFVVSNNIVHDNDNIGIDFIGFEGTGPSGSDQARNGTCVNNTVYNISSLSNPTYGGERSADGIYVDGGMNIIIERNTVYNCDIGIELASEHKGKNTQDILIRNNFVSNSYQANIMAGGYASSKGNAVNITIVNNTTYKGVAGEVALQYNCNNIQIKNNIFYALSGQSYLQNTGGNNTSITVNNNMYYGQSTTSPGSWLDANAKYSNPGLVNPPTNMHLLSTSAAINTGIDLGNNASGEPISGTLDIDNKARISNSLIDIGADEYESTISPSNQAPTVSLTSPANGATFTAPASVSIAATASDVDGTISKVDFYNGSTLLGSDASSPYSYAWTNVAAGTYTLTAKATDNAGAVTISAAITVVVNAAVNIPPTVSISSPLNNATFTTPANITINATAADADGTVSKVDFYNGATLLGTSITSPYSFTWANVAAGTYTTTAKATDNSGNVTTSSPVTIVVNGLPGTNVTIQAETACVIDGVLETKNAGFNGASYVNVNNAIGTTITWSVNSPVSQTVNLTFRYAGTTNRDMSLSVNGATPATVSFPLTGAFTTWNTSVVQITLAAGTNSLVVSSLTTDGGPNIDELTFNSPNISLGSCGQAPTVSITSPANNTTFTTPASVTINATAADADGTVSKVDFYNGTILLGSDASSPYSFTWTNVASGTYSITALATDNSGSMTSAAISITVSTAVNQMPVVSITTPSGSTIGCQSTAIMLTASASDADGSISKVEFYDGTTLLSTVTSSPYAFNWTNAGTGTHSITAKATDNVNAGTTSGAVSIIINGIPSAPAVVTPVTYCQNATAAALTATGTSLKWYPVPTSGTGSATAPTPSTSATGTTSYYVSQTTNGCESARATIAVTVNGIPSAPGVSTPSNYCQNATATALTATGTALKWYTVPANGTSSTTTPIPSTTATGTISYYVSQTTNGCESARAMIMVTVNALPSATITAGGPTTFTQGGSVVLSANTGTGLTYRWLNGPAQVGTGSTYTATTGADYTVEVTNASGCKTTSSVITVTVNGNQSPTASITSPANNATVTSPASITINATSNDTDGTVSKVDFYNGSTFLGSDNSAPYSFIWTGVVAGTYSITAVATDNLGASGTSAVITVIVNNQAPTVSITSPANNAAFTAPASVTITATAADADGTVIKVEFYNGTILLGTAASTPYSFAFNNLSAGTYALTAKATDNQRGVTTSAAVNIIVNPNQSSVITIVSPTDHSTVTGNSVTIEVNATDPDGSITKVEYMDGNTVLGTSTTQPYSFTWNNLTAGMHVLTVRVTDSNGGMTTSTPTSFTVGTGTGITSSYGAFTHIYPNPSMEAFTVKASQGIKNLAVVNMYGIEVINLQDISAYQQVEIGKDLADGTYVLFIKYASDKMEVAKLVKIK